MILLLLEANDYDKAKSRYVALLEPASDLKDYLAVERLEKDFDDTVRELTEQKILFAFDEADYDTPKITEFFRDYDHVRIPDYMSKARMWLTVRCNICSINSNPPIDVVRERA